MRLAILLALALAVVGCPDSRDPGRPLGRRVRLTPDQVEALERDFPSRPLDAGRGPR